MDKDGKIVAADLDCAQTKVKYEDVADLSKVDLRTKKEKKEEVSPEKVETAESPVAEIKEDEPSEPNTNIAEKKTFFNPPRQDFRQLRAVGAF